MSPSNRPSKQRRAADNRAKRQALAARRENATYEPPVRERTSAKGSSAAPARGAGRTRGAGGGFLKMGSAPRREGRPVGAMALQIALSLSAVGAFLLPGLDVKVDEDGNALSAKEIKALEDDGVDDIRADSYWEVRGPGLTIFGMVAPVAVTGYALYEATRGRRRIWVTFGAMLGLGLATTFSGTFFSLGAMVAVAVASFQMRRAQLKANQPAADDAPADDQVIDADVVEDGEVLEADMIEADVIEAESVDADDTRTDDK